MTMATPPCTCDSPLRAIFGDRGCEVHGTRWTRDQLVSAEAARDRYRELAAVAIRAHTRAIHALAGNCEYPEAERAEMGAYLAQELQR